MTVKEFFLPSKGVRAIVILVIAASLVSTINFFCNNQSQTLWQTCGPLGPIGSLLGWIFFWPMRFVDAFKINELLNLILIAFYYYLLLIIFIWIFSFRKKPQNKR